MALAERIAAQGTRNVARGPFLEDPGNLPGPKVSLVINVSQQKSIFVSFEG